MSFLVDTDICSYYLRGKTSLFTRFTQHSGRLHMSVITLGELYTWALRGKAPPGHLQGLLALVSDLILHDVNHEVARKFGEMRAQLLDQGRSIATADLLIAATALVQGLTMVTHNTRDFVDIPELRVADWLAP